MNSLLTLATDSTGSAVGSFVESLKFWETQVFSNFLRSLLSGIIILIVGWIVLKIIIRSVSLVFKRSKKVSDLMADYIRKIILVVGWIIITIIFLSHLGVNMGPVIAGLGITGVVLGLAFQDSLSSFFAGAMIVLNEPFRKGDYIEVGANSGSVVSIDLFCVTLSTPDGKKVIISNKVVWGSPITNYSFTKMRGISMTIGVPYDSDLVVCRKVFKDLLESYPEVLKEPEVRVEVHELADSSINFLLRPWVLPDDYWKVYWRFHSEICGKLAEKNVFLPFKQLDVNLKQEK